MARTVPWADRNKFRRAEVVPIIGPWVGRVGRVIQIASNPCVTTPEVWVYAAFSAVPTMMFFFAKMSPSDTIAERVGGKNRSKKKFKLKITMTLTAPLANPDGSKANWVVFKSFHLLRMVGYYFTIADMVTAGVVNWMSTAYRYSGCTTQGANGAYASLRCLPGTVGMPFLGSWTFNLWQEGQSHLMATGPTGIACSSAHIPSVGFVLTQMKNEFHLPDASFTAKLVRSPGDEVVAEPPTTLDSEGMGRSQGFYYNGFAINRLANKTLSNGAYRVVITQTSGALQFSGGSMSGTGAPFSDAITPDP